MISIPSTEEPRHSVFVVEDDAGVASFLSCALNMLGFRVLHAPEVRSALAAMALERPDVLLTDCNLPETSGIQLIEELRATDRQLAIIGMSAEHFKGQDMLNAGASAFLEKPLEVETLREALAAYV